MNADESSMQVSDLPENEVLRRDYFCAARAVYVAASSPLLETVASCATQHQGKR